jgi:WD40 repeat protein
VVEEMTSLPSFGRAPALAFLSAVMAITTIAGRTAQNRPPQPSLVVQQSHSTDITAAAFSNDGRLIASGSKDGNVMVWNTSGSLIGRLTDVGAAPLDIAFSPDDSMLAATSGSAVVVWDITRLQRTARLTIGDVSPFKAVVAFTPDSKSIIASFYGGLFRWVIGSEWTEPGASKFSSIDSDSAIAIPPSSTWGVVVDSDGKTTKFSLATGAILSTTESLCDLCGAVAIRSDGLFVAALRVDSIQVLDTTNGAVISHRIPLNPWGTSIAFAQNGSIALYDDTFDGLMYVDPRSGQISRTGKLHIGPGRLEISPDGTFIFVGWEHAWLVNLHQDSSIELGERIQAPTDLAVSIDSRWLLTSNQGATLWNLDTGTPQRIGPASIRGERWWNETVGVRSAMNDVGTVVALSSFRTLVGVLDGRLAWTKTLRSTIRSIAVSRSGQHIASADDDGRVYLWDAKSGQEIWSRSGPKRPVYLAFSASDTWIAVGGDGVTVWSTSSNRRAALQIRGNDRAHPFPIAFSFKGSMIAVGNNASGKPSVVIHDIEAKRSWLVNSAYQARALAFSPDDKELAVLQGSYENRESVVFGGRFLHYETSVADLFVYDANSGATLGKWTGNADTVTYLDRERLITASEAKGAAEVHDRKTLEATGFLVPSLDEWIVASPMGQFDGSAEGIRRLVGWRFQHEVYPADQYFGRFYQPGLLPLIVGKRTATVLAPASDEGLPIPPSAQIIDLKVTAGGQISVRAAATCNIGFHFSGPIVS